MVAQAPQHRLFSLEALPPTGVVLAAFGMGVDSTAYLIDMVNRGWPAPYAILAADTKGEHPHTYEHRARFSEWLIAHGYPPVIVPEGPREGLEANCLRRKALPAIAYGFKTCSQRWKLEPQEKWANNDLVCRAEWDAGRKVTRLIGYEVGEEYRNHPGDKKFANRYLLQEWNMDRDACEVTCLETIGYIPGKSSCFFCPEMQPEEIIALDRRYPDLAQRARQMEANADLTALRGLGRDFSWSDLLDGKPIKFMPRREKPCGCFDGGTLL